MSDTSSQQVSPKFVALFLLVLLRFVAVGQSDTITAVTNTDAEYLIREVFLGGGDCFNAFNFQLTGSTGQAGVFINGSASIGMETGIILSNGDVEGISGPNTSFNFATPLSTGYGNSSTDPDLVILSESEGNSNPNFSDIVILEFDFVPTLDTISFDFVFASEEYCEFVLSSFIDLFGFFISGPGINGPYSNNGINIASVPGTDQPITAGTVNQFLTPQYYVNNIPPGNLGCSLNAPAAAPGFFGFDGYTIPLTAAAAVIPCETYHLKLIVSDRGFDDKLDAAVFLRANSFAAGRTAQISSAIDGVSIDGFPYEGCATANVTFTRGDNLVNNDLTVDYDILPTSTATPGLDYTALPDSIIIPAGQLSVTVPIQLFADDDTESVEAFTIRLRNPCDCSQSSLTINIVDAPALDVAIVGPDRICLGDGLELAAVPSGGTGIISYIWPNGDVDSLFNVVPLVNTTYQLMVQDECLNRDTIDFSVTVQSPRANIFGSEIICDGRPPASIGVALSGSINYNFNVLTNGNPTAYTNINTDTLWIPVTGTGGYQLANFTGDGCPGSTMGFAQSLAVDIQTSIQLDSIGCFGADDGGVAVLPVGGSGMYTYTWEHDPTLATRFANNVSSNTYAVTIEDSNGCQDEVSVYLPEPPPMEVAIDTLALVANCFGSGSLQASATGGTVPYSFLWSNGQTTALNTNLAAGNYLLTVRDANNCLSNMATTILADSLAPNIQLQVAAALDCTTMSTNIDATVSDMGANAIYRWTDASGTVLTPPVQPLQLPVSSSGTYFLTVENPNNGCTAMASVQVDDASGNPSFTLAGITNLDCLQPTATLTLGNLQPTWQITWLDANDDPLATQVDNYTVSAPGSYAVVVRDPANGCTMRQPINIGGSLAVPELTLVTPPSLLDCATSNTPITMAASGGSGNYAYTWTSPVGGIVGNAQLPNITAQEPGTYTLVVEDQLNHCTDTLSATVVRDVSALTIDPIADTVFTCAVNAISLTATSPNMGNLTYQWLAADGTVLANVPDVDIPAPGTYTVRVTDLDNNCFQTRIVNVGIDTVAPTVVLLPHDELTCSRTSVQLGAQPGGGLFVPTWTDANGLEIGTGTWTTNVGLPGNYSLAVANTQNGCATQTQLTVALDTVAPQISILLPQGLTCDRTTVALAGQLLSAPGSYTYQWTGAGLTGPDSNLQATATTPGSYTLSATNTDNGCVAQVQATVTQDTVAPPLPALADVVLNCYQPTAMLDGTVGTPASLQYRWENAAGTVLTNTPALTVGAAGTYRLFVTNTANGCESSRTVAATANLMPPTANAGDDAEITCDQTTATLTGVPGSPTWTPTWRNANGDVVATNTWTLATSLTGNYTLSVEDTTNGCTATDVATVTQNQNVPTANAGADQILDCFTQTATLQGTPATTNGVTYTLLDAAGQVVGQGNAPVFTVAAIGTYRMVVYNPANDCSATDEVVVREVVPAIDAVTLADITCLVPTGSIEVETVSGGTAPYLYSIDAGATWQPGNVFGNLTGGAYDIVVQDANGCEAEQAATLLESGGITILLPEQVTLSSGDTYRIRAEIDRDMADVASIQWANSPQLSCTDCPSPTFTAGETEIVAVTVTGTDGCVATAKMLLIVDQRVPIYVPNAFSPHNGDGINEAFTVFGDVSRVADVASMRIFDRWGNLVFNKENFPINNPDLGWDGTLDGRPLNAAVFVYSIAVRLRNGETVLLQGEVVLVE